MKLFHLLQRLVFVALVVILLRNQVRRFMAVTSSISIENDNELETSLSPMMEETSKIYVVKKAAVFKDPGMSATDTTKVPLSKSVSIPWYTEDMARQAVMPQWGLCQRRHPKHDNRTDNNKQKKNNDRVKFAFVHIYKTAGSTLRQFFLLYAKNCGLGWMVLISCTNVRASSVLPTKINTNVDDNITAKKRNCTNCDTGGSQYWEPCRLKRLLQRNGKAVNVDQLPNAKSKKKRVDKTLAEQKVDILGGHFKIGTVDYLVRQQSVPKHKSTTTKTNKKLKVEGAKSNKLLDTSNDIDRYNKIRYITFLRQPLSKYVSGVVFHHKDIKSKTEIIAKIKRDVIEARRKGKYWLRVVDYLLTPLQAASLSSSSGGEDLVFQNMDGNPMSKSSTEYKTELVLQNLVNYNVIVGIVENMSNSMSILQHVLDPDHRITPLFAYYGGGLSKDNVIPSSSTGSTNTTTNTNSRPNSSTMIKKIVNKSRFSTNSILEELEQDKVFFQSFVEYVKYEQLIYDFALAMHQKQLDAATGRMEHPVN